MAQKANPYLLNLVKMFLNGTGMRLFPPSLLVVPVPSLRAAFSSLYAPAFLPSDAGTAILLPRTVPEPRAMFSFPAAGIAGARRGLSSGLLTSSSC